LPKGIIISNYKLSTQNYGELVMSQKSKNNIGFIGLGLLGLPVAQKLADKGFSLVVWNREPDRPLLLTGDDITIADSPAQVAAEADIIFLCVIDDNAVDDVVLGANGISTNASTQTLIVDHSTCDPDRTRARACKLLQATGAHWIDAPVSGGPVHAVEGKLIVMCGGSPEDLDRVAEPLAAYSGNVTLMGDVGAGQTTKVINQAICGVGYVLMAEVYHLAETSGLDTGRLPDCLAGGHADSTMLQFALPKMVADDFLPVASRASQMAKDMKNVAGAARNLGLNLPLVEGAHQAYAAYVAAGHGNAETASVNKLHAASRAKTDKGL
jgi:3-hydroxyisobutyrate dehydrogenase